MKKAKYKIDQVIKTKDGIFHCVIGILFRTSLVRYEVQTMPNAVQFIDEDQIESAYDEKCTTRNRKRKANVKSKVQEMPNADSGLLGLNNGSV